LRWLNAIIDGDNELLDKVDGLHTVEEFESRVRDCISQPASDDAQPIIAEVAEKLQIVPVGRSDQSEPVLTDAPQ
jgi:hypothetical protein